MMLIEGMKELKLLEKRMRDNTEKITKYSSGLSNEKETFGSEKKQRLEVSSLIQSNIDLFKHYLKLKTAIEKTNINTTIHFNDIGEFNLVELLAIRRRMSQPVLNTFHALTTREADNKMRVARIPENVEVQVVRYYDEEEKNNQLRKWMDFFDAIDGKLEVVNATTPLLLTEEEEEEKL